MANEETRALALAWIDQLITEADEDEWSIAVAYVVITTNAETKQIHVNGPFVEQDDAEFWAEQHEHDLNRDNAPDDDPFVVRVYPVVGTS